MLDLLSSHPGTIAVIVLALATAIAVMVVVHRCARETDDDRQTVCAILGIRDAQDRNLVSIRYGKPLLPFTWGRTSNIRIRVPVRAIPRITAPEEAVEAGIRLQQALGMDDSETRMCKPRVREWTLS